MRTINNKTNTKQEETRFPNARLVDKNDESKGWVCVCQCNFAKENGQPKRVKRNGKTKREAEQRAYEARDLEERLHKRNVDDRRNYKKTLGEYMEEWLPIRFNATQPDGTTKLEYLQLLNRTFFKNKISKFQIRQLNYDIFDNYYRNIVKCNCKSAYNTTRQLINGLCDYLVFRGILEENYSSMIKTKWEKREDLQLDENGEVKEKTHLTDDDFIKLVDFMRTEESRYTPAFILMAETFIRENELFALHINDIDLEKGVMYINRSLGRRSVDQDEIKVSRSVKHTELYLKEATKIGEKKMVTLSPLAIEALTLMLKNLRKCKNNPMGLLFPIYSNGHFMSYASFQNTWISICDKVGIYRPKGMGPYACKHTGITISARESNIENVAMLAGHKNSRTTKQYYTHTNIEAMRCVKTPGMQLLEETTIENIDLSEEQEKALLKILIKKYGIIE